MKYLQTYKLFESISDDAYEKWVSAKTEYDAKISELKKEYLEGVSQCMFDLTDEFNHTSSVKLADNFRQNSGGDLVAKFKFDVKTEKIDHFFDTLEGLEDTVKSFISQYRRIQISSISFIGGNNDDPWSARTEVSRIYKQNIYSLKDIKERVDGEIKKYQSRLNFAGIVITVEI